MATAIEYGLVAVLIAVAGCAAVSCSTSSPVTNNQSAAAETAEDTSILQPVGNQESSASSVAMFDSETGCQYISTSQGVTIRYRQDGTPDCPGSIFKDEKPVPDEETMNFSNAM